MKIIITSLFIVLALNSFSQSSLPSVEIRNLDGAILNSSEIENDGKPMVISFWATWCKPCVKELSAISELYEDWVEETGVKVVAISIDDTKSMTRVKPFVNAKGWEFDIFMDPNSDFKRAMNVVNVPHTFLLDGDLNIVSQHTTYAEGDEEELYDKILEITE